MPQIIRNRKLLTLDVAVSDPPGMPNPKLPESAGNPPPPSPEEIDMQRALPPWGVEPAPTDLLDERMNVRPEMRPRHLLNPWAAAPLLGVLAPRPVPVVGRAQIPMPPPPGATPCPCPPRYFPCPLTRADRRKLDAADPVVRRFQAEMDADEGEALVASLVARVQAGEQPPRAPAWLEQRMEEAALADDERQLVRLLFAERPELAGLPPSALLLRRGDPTTGEDLDPVLVPADSLLP